MRTSGFHWGNPFYSNGPQQLNAQSKRMEIKNDIASLTRKSPGRNKISLRARTLNGEKLKVNDKGGNPVELAAVVVWRMADTAASRQTT